MVILGLDPGLERIGFGAIRTEGSRVQLIECGLIQTPRVALPERLGDVDRQVRELLERLKPDRVATERLLFTKNQTTAMDVAKALGVLLLAIGQRGVPWYEYSPPEVKQSVVGVGNAEKRQVQFMVAKILSLSEAPKPDDVADALAIALCDSFRSRLPSFGPGEPPRAPRA